MVLRYVVLAAWMLRYGVLRYGVLACRRASHADRYAMYMLLIQAADYNVSVWKVTRREVKHYTLSGDLQGLRQCLSGNMDSVCMCACVHSTSILAGSIVLATSKAGTPDAKRHAR